MRSQILLSCCIAGLLTLSSLWERAACAEPPTQEELQTGLRSVCVKSEMVFAVNRSGLYRADRESRLWARLDLPEHMPPGGLFARLPEGSDLLIYKVSEIDQYNVPRHSGHRFGIYLSRDAGDSWELIAEHHDYGPVLLHEDGTLYAITNPHHINEPSRVHRSADLGQTWEDITGESYGMILEVFPDPDHPNLVCLRVNSIRSYVMQAEDESYAWNPIVEWEWHPEVRQTAGFFDGFYSTQTTAHTLVASMENYFDYEFEDQTSLCAFEISPENSRFEFEPGEPVSIPLTLAFRENLPMRSVYWKQQGSEGPEPTPAVIRMIDDPESIDVWGIRVEHDDRRDIRRTRASEFVYNSRQRDAARAAVRAQDRWHEFELSAAEPYQRTVDLDGLYDFSRPGTYRVQLFYDNGWVAERSRGEWIGSFTSPVVEVVVAEEQDS